MSGGVKVKYVVTTHEATTTCEHNGTVNKSEIYLGYVLVLFGPYFSHNIKAGGLLNSVRDRVRPPLLDFLLSDSLDP